MRAFAGGHEDRIDLGAGNDAALSPSETAPRFLRQVARPRRVRVGNRHESDGGMLRREARAQAPDAAGADDGDAQFLAFDDPLLPVRAVSGTPFYVTNHHVTLHHVTPYHVTS